MRGIFLFQKYIFDIDFNLTISYLSKIIFSEILKLILQYLMFKKVIIFLKGKQFSSIIKIKKQKNRISQFHFL